MPKAAPQACWQKMLKMIMTTICVHGTGRHEKHMTLTPFPLVGSAHYTAHRARKRKAEQPHDEAKDACKSLNYPKAPQTSTYPKRDGCNVGQNSACCPAEDVHQAKQGTETSGCSGSL